jgi:N-acetyl-anhydromuramyl-L-alanine amidase AmpD
MSKIVDLAQKLPWHKQRVWSTRRLKQIDKIIIHQALCDCTLEQVNEYHITPGAENHLSPQGAPHFAYHYGIRQKDDEGNKDGEIIQANDLSDITWHTGGQNTSGVGVLLQGNFRGTGYDLEGVSDGPTEKQMQSLEWLVNYLVDFLRITPQDVYGHYHFGKPACPGYKASEWIEAYRLRELHETAEKQARIRNVKDLQEALEILGYEPGKVDGIIGSQTMQAIRKFQREQQLVVDGVAGPQTKGRLITLLKATRKGVGNDRK